MARAKVIALVAAVWFLAGCAGTKGARIAGDTRPGIASGEMYIVPDSTKWILVADEKAGLEAARTFWIPAAAVGLTDREKAFFAGGRLTECRSAIFDGARAALVTGEPSGAAVVRASDGRILFVTETPSGPESAEVLPGGAIIVASRADGGTLSIHHRSAQAAATYGLAGARGVAWDAKRKSLWALGSDTLNRYSYRTADGAPALALEKEAVLPGPGGVDVYPRSGRDELIVVTYGGVFSYDPANDAWKPFEPIGEMGGVTSAGDESRGGSVVWTLSDGTVMLKKGKDAARRFGSGASKVRWDRLQEFTYGYGTARFAGEGFPTRLITLPR